MNIIGFDFSINKPAACIFSNGKYSFMSWPYSISDKSIKTFRESGITIIDRIDNKEHELGLTSKMRWEVENARYLSNLITESLKCYFNGDTYLAFEGLSYGSGGDSGIQLGGYKYILMNELSQYVSLDHMYTYSPITIKSIAGCAKKGMGKSEMIDEFIRSGPPHCKFRLKLFEKREIFMKKGGRNWIEHVDDLVDAYWVIQTILKKEEIQCLV